MVRSVVGGRDFDFSKEEIERRMRDVEPEPIREHQVEVNGRPYPPKQVIATVTEWDRLSFTTMEAQRVLTRAGLLCRRNGNMALGGPRVMVPVRAGEIGRLDQLAIHAGRMAVALEAVKSAQSSATKDLELLQRALHDLMNDQEVM